MASEKILQSKQQYVDELAAKLEAAAGGVIVDYKGITVAEDTELRKQLREAGVDYFVVKNTLLKRAAEKAGITGIDEHLEGTTAIAISGKEDPLAAARILNKFAEASKGKYEIKAGYMEGKALDANEVKAMANLPGREGLLSMLLSALQGNLSGLARAIDAVRAQKEGEAA